MQFNQTYIKLHNGFLRIQNISLQEDKYKQLTYKLKHNGCYVKYDKLLKDCIYSICDLCMILYIMKQMSIINCVSKKTLLLVALLYNTNKNIKMVKTIPYWSDEKKLQPYPFQKEGVSHALAIKNLILAFGLGLGKCPTSLATMCCAIKQYGFKKILIVVPSKLKQQWFNEYKKFTKGVPLTINVFDMFKTRPKKAILQNNRIEQIKKSSILIISYGMVTKYKEHLKKESYNMMILDESSRIKNNTKQTRAIESICKVMDINSIRMFVTGTPIENKLEDIYYTFKIIDKNIFGNKNDFENSFCILNYHGAVTGYRNIEHFKKKIEPYYIRKTSHEVWKERPNLNQTYELCEMIGRQKKVYNDSIASVLSDIRDLKRQEQINKAKIAPLISILLSVACTSKSIEPNYTGTDHSCKTEQLINILQQLSPDDKVLIFCRYANMVIPHLCKELAERTEYNIYKITGQDTKNDAILNKFKHNKSILVASDSISYGTNIQFANYLVNFDLVWNPAVYAQRIGRLYRMGQQKNVTVVNLIAQNTFDELVYDKLYNKQTLSDQIFTKNLGAFDTDMTMVDMITNMDKGYK